MKFYATIFILVLLYLTLSVRELDKTLLTNEIKIEWIKDMAGDFSFHHKWAYPEGVYKDEFGQLNCDGLCPEETDAMKDKQGKIISDSLTRFYSFVDTSHLPFSLASEAQAYEFSGTNYINFQREKGGVLIGRSACNVSTHSFLEIKLDGKTCTPSLVLNSVSNSVKHRFELKSGSFQLDPYYYKKGVIKAFFDFQFINSIDPDTPLTWKGKIYSPIES